MGRLKSLAGDTVIYGLMTVFGRFITFMLTPIYTNFLSKSEIGEVNNVFVYFALIVIFYSFGMESAFFRFFKKDDERRTQKVFSHSFLSMTLLGGLCTLLLVAASPFIAGDFYSGGDATTLFILSAFIPLTDIIMYIPYGMLRMTRRAKKFAYTKFMIICLVFALNLLFITVLETGIAGVIWAQLLANLVGCAVLLPLIIKNLRLEFDRKLLKDMFVFGFPTLPASLSQIVLQVSDRIIVKQLCGSEILGLYSVNYRLGIPMMLFVSLFEYAWKPFYLSHFEDSDAKQLFSRIFTYFTLTAGVVFIGAALFLSDFVQLPSIGGRVINPQYYSGMNIIPIILLAYFFNGAYNQFAAGIQITKTTKYLPIPLLIAGAVNIAANYALIPIYGYEVAAWTTLLSYFIAAGILYYYSQKVYPLQYEWKRVGIIAVATAATYFAAMELTVFEVSLENVLIKIATLAIFVGLLKVLGFFNQSELALIKRIIRRK